MILLYIGFEFIQIKAYHNLYSKLFYTYRKIEPAQSNINLNTL